LAVQVGYADNWTRFRGPNGSGQAGERQFPHEWKEDDYLWKSALPGVGNSSPVGWEDRIFITSGDPETGAVTLSCLSSQDGSEIWQREFAGKTYKMHNLNSYASTTPAVDAERVYLSWSEGGKMNCAALTHQGDFVWRASLGEFAEGHGFAASPVAIDGVVCLQVDLENEGFLAGIDAASGEVRWRSERPSGKAAYATPCAIAMVGSTKAVISQSMTGGMQAIDVETGKILWQDEEIFPARCVSSPFVADNMVIGVCGGGGSGKKLVGMDLTSAETGQERLLLTKHIPYVPTPVVAGDLMFLWHDRGTVSCVDLRATDPSKLLWTERLGKKIAFFGSPILAGDKLYGLSTDGRAIVIAAARNFELLGITDLGEPTRATPAVHQGRMYLRTESSLACLPAK
jgi:hypothetical protein